MIKTMITFLQRFFRKLCRSFLRRHIHAKQMVKMTKEYEQLNKEKRLLERELEIKDNYLKRAEKIMKENP